MYQMYQISYFHERHLPKCHTSALSQVISFTADGDVLHCHDWEADCSDVLYFLCEDVCLSLILISLILICCAGLNLTVLLVSLIHIMY